MSLDKSIKHGKEHRKQYRDSRRWDCTCRNHGSCSYCRSSRTIFDTRARMGVITQHGEWLSGRDEEDPYEATMAEANKTYRRMGIDPDDWDTLVELGELYKG